MSSTTNVPIDLSDDDSLPASSGLSKSKRQNTNIPAAPKTASTKPSHVAKAKQPPKKKVKPSKAYTLIWVCHWGKGRSSTWRKKDLKIVGIYATKADAEAAKREVMSQHQCCGHGDILVGPTTDDEIDLIIREAPLHL